MHTVFVLKYYSIDVIDFAALRARLDLIISGKDPFGLIFMTYYICVPTTSPKWFLTGFIVNEFMLTVPITSLPTNLEYFVS